MRTLLSYWSFTFSSLILVILLIIYVFWTKGIRRKGVFYTLLPLVILCFFSPLQVLSNHYLFSAHMVVHVLLLLVIGPLLLISGNSKTNNFFFFGLIKDHPMLSWVTGVGIMWIWHLPRIFNALMGTMHGDAFSLISIFEPLTLVLGGAIFSSPIIHPDPQYRIDPLSGVVYLFTACIGCSLLGLLITFAPGGTYHHFLSMHDHLGLNKIILRNGITQSIDQQAAGLIMWVPCCLVYVSGAMYLLARWFHQKEEAVLSK